MTERGRREYAAVMHTRYAQADKRARGQLLDEYCRTTGCHRKAAIRRLRTPPHPAGRSPGRPCRYPARELAPILERAWLASDQLSGKLLRPLLPVLLTALETHHGLRVAPVVRTALTTASAATLDRLLRPLRRRRPRQPGRVARTLTPLRAQVPLRTWREWTGVAPGRAARRPRLALRRVSRLSRNSKDWAQLFSSADSSPPWWLTSIRSMTSRCPTTG